MAHWRIYDYFQPNQREPSKSKKIFSIILAIAVTLSFMPIFARAENEDIEVYITVSDITDYTEPMKILVERQKLSVSEFNLADFGDTLTGIECIEGITYLHALVQLHRNLYGDEKVSDNLLLTTDGVTKIFMGNSVANVMYKNGKDIFALPQLINIADGDEIQVCLYDEGHSQAIATFNEARLDNISPHETITLTLQQHYGYPRDRDAIANAEITTNTGEYITDENGNIVTTDDDGNFNVSFSNEGTYTISAMPIINYYMSDTGGGIKVEWIPQTVLKEVECTTYNKNADTDPLGKALYDVVYGDDEDGMIMLFDWNAKHTEPFITISKDIETAEKTVIGYEEVTELVKVETIVPDELEPMVTHTTPFVTVNVTTDLSFENIYLNSANDLVIVTKNAKYHSNDDVYIAGYNGDTLQDCITFKSVSETIRANFSEAYDYYKIFVWQDGTMIPIIKAETYNPNEIEVMSLDYDYTMPIPENTYITEKG